MKKLDILLIGLSFLFSSCSFFSANKEDEELDFDVEITEEVEVVDSDYVAVPFQRDSSGLMIVRASINGLGVDMKVDTGASVNTISILEANYLAGKGLLSSDDIVGLSTSSLADGSIVPGLRIMIRELILADRILLNNVPFVVLADNNASLLLGQSVLSNFRYEVDPSMNEIKFYDY